MIHNRTNKATFPLIGFVLLATIRLSAVTGGPQQPEAHQFTSASTEEMVDLFSGDFSYNIPLFELPGPNGGYPFNLGYSSGITMDQEATWVGLGWNINVGAINRQVRGLPDEFDGEHDKVFKTRDQLPHEVFGVNLAVDFEAIGLDNNDIVKFAPSIGVKVYNDSYKGFGVSRNIGISLSFTGKGNTTGSIGLSLSNDNFEGASISPNIGVGGIKTGTDGQSMGFSLGFNYNARQGLTDVSLSQSVSQKIEKAGKMKESTSTGTSSSMGLSFNNNHSYTPGIQDETVSSSGNGSFKIGLEGYGVIVDPFISGFYSKEELRFKNQKRTLPAYGYLNLQAGYEKNDGILDFNRENDGEIHKDMKNLPNPILTYDVFSLTGQGVGGMFRPYRSDVGVLSDMPAKSNTYGGTLAIDIAAGNLVHGGGSGSGSWDYSLSHKWETGNTNDINNIYKYGNLENNNLKEPYFFEMYGDKSAQEIEELNQVLGYSVNSSDPAASLRNIEPTFIKPVQDGSDFYPGKDLLNGKTPLKVFTVNQNAPDNRLSRSTSIVQITNEMIQNNPNALPAFKVSYYTDPNNPVALANFNRTGLKPNHFAGFIVTNPDGTRYVYALPVYNKKQIEVVESVLIDDEVKNGTNIYNMSNTDKGSSTAHKGKRMEYLDKTETEEFVNSFLLTAVLGADYVDVTEDGVTKDDLGYWVKFTYSKDPLLYNWGAPYSGANYLEGLFSKSSDDKCSFMYGQREQYYLREAETKSHIAKFTISNRNDGKGIDNIPGLSTSAVSKKIDKIQLFSRNEIDAQGVNATPIQTTYFQYAKETFNPGSPSVTVPSYTSNPELCEGVPNAGGQRGKLTLKAVYMTYRNNDRGLLNPYVFDYNEDVAEENPDYNTHKYDRWGNYQENAVYDGMQEMKYFPYTKQPEQGKATEAQLNQWSAAWSLKEIKLPTGALVKIDYEADRYAYVQNKPAMQMYPISGINGSNDIANVKVSGYSLGNTAGNFVSVQLPQQYSGLSNTEKEELAQGLFDHTNQLYFKIYCDVKRSNKWEFVNGYADIQKNELGKPKIEINGDEVKIFLQDVSVGGKSYSSHPFAIAAWNFVQVNRPELLTSDNEPRLSTDDRTKEGMMDNFKSIMWVLFGPGFDGLAKYYTKAANNSYGTKVDLEKSYVRLNSLDGEKFGGGSRVKDVVITDRNGSVISGQYFDYTTKRGEQTISSGVAPYEPNIGGDENAIKYGSPYSTDFKMITNFKQFQELPINEGYYPSPSVGYSKVTVKSYATEQVLKEILPATVPTTGISVHEYYTSKDFPVISKETKLTEGNGSVDEYTPAYRVQFPVGLITKSFYTASQGYSIETNDMHGKEKKTTYFGITNGGDINPTPISYVEYLYKSRLYPDKVNGNIAYQLLNEVPVMSRHLETPQLKILGMDYEYFADSRYSESVGKNVGARFNVDVFMIGIFPIPLPGVFPDFGDDEKRVRTIVTNKIIHRFAIMDKTNVFKEGALTQTENLAYDAFTGNPVLTKLNNEYKDAIYNYSIPGYWVYNGIGPAYRNSNYSISGVGKGENFIEVTDADFLLPLINGDEVIVENGTTSQHYIVTKKVDKKVYFETPQGTNPVLVDIGKDYVVTIIRSAMRNQLTNNVGTVVSQHNPIQDADLSEKCQY
ncbi:MAG: hypothetical protein K1X55_00380 [Chitinophagales bacterium]|nr:hypothetical protein [Chitinophagales bacterium]